MLRNEMVGGQVAMVGQTNAEVPGGGDKEGIVTRITLFSTSRYFQRIFNHVVRNSQEVDTGVGIEKQKNKTYFLQVYIIPYKNENGDHFPTRAKRQQTRTY